MNPLSNTGDIVHFVEPNRSPSLIYPGQMVDNSKSNLNAINTSNRGHMYMTPQGTMSTGVNKPSRFKEDQRFGP